MNETQRGRAQRSREEWLDVLAGMTAGHLAGRPPVEAYDSGLEDMRRLANVGGWMVGDRILDIGSGNGRHALALTDVEVSYLGLDPMRACVDFARAAFAPWEHIRFEHVDVENPVYNPGGKIPPGEFVFPIADASVDVVIFSSVFTHLSRIDLCRHYLAQAQRVLRPGGRCVCSWFRSPPNSTSPDPHRTVFREELIRSALAGFELRYQRGGQSDDYHDQWVTVSEVTVP